MTVPDQPDDFTNADAPPPEPEPDTPAPVPGPPATLPASHDQETRVMTRADLMAAERADTQDLPVRKPPPMSQARLPAVKRPQTGADANTRELTKADLIGAHDLLGDAPDALTADTGRVTADSPSGSHDDLLDRLDRELSEVQAEPTEPPPATPRIRGGKPAPGSAKQPDTLATLLLRPITRFFRRPTVEAQVAPSRALALSVQDVCLYSDNRTVLDDVSFDVMPGEAVGIVGRNGCGKSVLLRICAGIVEPSSGLVLIDGMDPFRGRYRDRQQSRRKIGFVFQDGTLISNIPVYDNIAMPLRYHTPLDEESIARKVDIWLRRLDIEEVASMRPGNLTTHQARLVNVARALVIDPAIVMFDDPFASLDTHAIDVVTDIITELKAQGVTVIVTATGGQRILDVADRFGGLENGQLVRVERQEIRRQGTEARTLVTTPSGRQVAVRASDLEP